MLWFAPFTFFKSMDLLNKALLWCWEHSSVYSVLHSVSSLVLGTCSTTSEHSCLVTGTHFLPPELEHCSSSTYLVTEADLFSQTSSALSLQTWRGVLTSLQTCLVTGLHFWLVTTEHCCSVISLVRMLGTMLQTRRFLGLQSWTGTSWQCCLLSIWHSALGPWRHCSSGSSLHSCLGKERHTLEEDSEH